MERAIIHPAGFLIETWDPASQAHVQRPVENVFALLRLPCAIEPGTTLGDLFRVVAADRPLTAFLAAYSGCPDIDAFHAEARQPATERPDDPDPLQAVGISRHLEVGPLGLNDAVDFDGIGREVHYAIEFTPVNELAALPLRLERMAHVTIGQGPRQTKPHDVETSFSLLDVLDAVYYEISFTGGPADRDRLAQELAARVADVEAGRAQLVPLADLAADLENPEEVEL